MSPYLRSLYGILYFFARCSVMKIPFFNSNLSLLITFLKVCSAFSFKNHIISKVESRKYKKSLKYAILKELQLRRGKRAQFVYAYVGAEKPRALIASEFLSENIVPHYEAYYEQCFGEKSLLTDVRNSVTKKTKQTKLL